MSRHDHLEKYMYCWIPAPQDSKTTWPWFTNNQKCPNINTSEARILISINHWLPEQSPRKEKLLPLSTNKLLPQNIFTKVLTTSNKWKGKAVKKITLTSYVPKKGEWWENIDIDSATREYSSTSMVNWNPKYLQISGISVGTKYSVTWFTNYSITCIWKYTQCSYTYI